jgi:hypothetical protein
LISNGVTTASVQYKLAVNSNNPMIMIVDWNYENNFNNLLIYILCTLLCTDSTNYNPGILKYTAVAS